MSSNVSFTEQDHWKCYQVYNKAARNTSLPTAGAAFLTIGALVVISSASLCLMLPGVNVITQIVAPAYVPGTFALLIALPLAIIAFKNAPKRTRALDSWLEKLGPHLDEVAQKTPQKPGKYIYDTYIKDITPFDLRKNLLMELNKRHEKVHKGEGKKDENEQCPYFRALKHTMKWLDPKYTPEKDDNPEP